VASHHAAVLPNVNTVEELRDVCLASQAMTSALFASIARAYLAAMMPASANRQTPRRSGRTRPLFPHAGRQPIELAGGRRFRGSGGIKG